MLKINNIKPLVSVIIPLYNAEKYIAETIENVLSQTYSNLEILVINDGSTDNSLAVAKQFENDIVKIFSQGNQGASAARNYGLREAKGDYIQFLDADDLLSRNKVEEQIKILTITDGNKVAICPTIYFFDDEDIYQQEVIHEWYKEESDNTADFLIKLYGGGLIGSTYGGMITIHSWLTPKNVIDKAGLWNEELSVDDDGEFFCRVVLASTGVKYADKAVNYYRKYRIKKSLSTQKDKAAVQSSYNAINLKKKWLLEKTDAKLARIAIARCLHELSFSCYPQFFELSKLAESEAKDLGLPTLKFYNQGIKKYISLIFGWKFINKFLKKK